MISLLFVNATILISFIFLGNQLFQNKNINLTTHVSIKDKLLLGFITGLAGCVLIFYSITISDSIHLDFRIIAMIIASIYGGFLSNLVTTTLIVIFRIGYYGVNEASIIGSLGLIVLLLAYSIICSFKTKFKMKFIQMFLFNLLYGIIVFSILISKHTLLIEVLKNYIFGNTIVCALVYYILNYIRRLNDLNRKLKYESTKDFLTGLNNVRSFDNMLNILLHNTVEKNEHLSILMLDIDFFKKVNDTYGHSSGDLVLKQFSDILTNSCRSFDIVSRNGGEEFTAILLDCNCKHATEIAERIRKNVEEALFTIEGNKQIHVTVSIGVASYPDSVLNINNILHSADDALYLAKRTGRNKVC
ncbi:GGDEF domain-containing protein [Clostridium zeae]|uniref:GGDEF domain-containing protein n=1 Tax=Clostridium zeae TaxID=2759022 RepID=A0ABQ1EC19_9CLOT|nr:diguanylate cyclase [Clostridium zeae]GFZ32248.1 GGDEF domain-containing protein [Clostridium zeae]